MPLATSKGTGVINLRTNPPDVTIYLDGEEYTVKTPASINNIPAGEHTYTMRKDGYLDYTGNTIVGDTQLCCIDIDMMISKETGQCSTQSVPSYELPIPITPPKPDYGMLIIGLLAGILIVKVIEKK